MLLILSGKFSSKELEKIRKLTISFLFEVGLDKKNTKSDGSIFFLKTVKTEKLETDQARFFLYLTLD